MSNVSVRTRVEHIYEISVPAPATARDIGDLLRVATQRCEDLTPGKAGYDDAFLVEARDDEIVAVIRVND